MNHLTCPFVHELANLKVMGHSVHHSWYKVLKLPDGSTDFMGITLFSEIVYKHIPVYDDKSGNMVQKFKGDRLCISLSSFASKFDVPSRAISEGFSRLQRLGLIVCRSKKNDPETIIIEPIVNAIKASMFDARRAAPACPNPSESDPTPRLAPASPSALRQRGNVQLDPSMEKKVQDFVNIWRDCQEMTNHQTRIRPGDVDAARKHFQINPEMEIREVMSQAVEAWFASQRKRPLKGFDPYFHCRKSPFMGYFFEYRDRILDELRFENHEEPGWVKDVLQRMEHQLDRPNSMA